MYCNLGAELFVLLDLSALGHILHDLHDYMSLKQSWATVVLQLLWTHMSHEALQRLKVTSKTPSGTGMIEG